MEAIQFPKEIEDEIKQYLFDSLTYEQKVMMLYHLKAEKDKIPSNEGGLNNLLVPKISFVPGMNVYSTNDKSASRT